MDRAIKKVAFSVFHKYIKRDDYFRFARFFNESQYWPRDKIMKYQWKAFKSLLEYACENVPYYRRLFNDIGITLFDITNREDQIKIPELTKEIVINNFDALRSKNFDQYNYRRNSTSGSTGVNLVFLSDQSIIRTALQKRCYDWLGVDFLDKKMTIWGAGWDVKKAQKLKSRIRAYFKNWMVLSGYNLSDSDIEKYYELMLSFNPSLLVSYPSILYTISEFFQKHGYEFTPKAIQIGGEKLFPFQREFIENVFQTKIFDFYGARDMRMIAQECDQHNGLHIMAENVLVEVLDDNNNPVEEGEGDLVITDLHNRVMPFIRYRIGDRAIITQRECDCGRGLPLLQEVLGRSFEILEFPNGNKVGGTFWTLVLRSEPGIRQFQVVQIAIDFIQINYVPDGELSKKSIENIINKIYNLSGNKLKIKFNSVDDIPASRAGKFHFVVSEIK